MAVLDIGRNGYKIVPIIGLFFHFGKPFLNTGQEKGCLAPIVFQFNSQVLPVETPTIVVFKVKEISRPQVRDGALAVKLFLLAEEFFRTDFCKTIPFIRGSKMFPIDINFPPALC